MHLGATLTNSESLVRTCSCREAFERGMDNVHGLMCSNKGDERLKLHNGICEVLHEIMKKIHPQADIERELVVLQILTLNARGGPSHVTHTRADIIRQRGVQKVIIDELIVHPGGKLYIRNPILSHLNQDAAALAVENRKRLHHRKISVPAAIPGAAVSHSC